MSVAPPEEETAGHDTLHPVRRDLPFATDRLRMGRLERGCRDMLAVPLRSSLRRCATVLKGATPEYCCTSILCSCAPRSVERTRVKVRTVHKVYFEQ